MGTRPGLSVLVEWVPFRALISGRAASLDNKRSRPASKDRPVLSGRCRWRIGAGPISLLLFRRTGVRWVASRFCPHADDICA